MVLGKLPVPGRPTIRITVGQGHTVLAVGAGGVCLDIFTLIYPFSPLSPSLRETARYRLKYCLKGPLNPKQPTNISPIHTCFWTILRSCVGQLCFATELLIGHNITRSQGINTLQPIDGAAGNTIYASQGYVGKETWPTMMIIYTVMVFYWSQACR